MKILASVTVWLVAGVVVLSLFAGCESMERKMVKKPNYDPSRDPAAQTYNKVEDLYGNNAKETSSYAQETQDLINAQPEFSEYRILRDFIKLKQEGKLTKDVPQGPSVDEQYIEQRTTLMAEANRIVSRYYSTHDQQKADQLLQQAHAVMVKVVELDEKAELRDYAQMEDFIALKRKELYDKYSDPNRRAQSYVDDLVRDLR